MKKVTRSIGLWMGAASLLAVVATVLAQDKNQAQAPMTITAAPEMKQVASLVGEWEVTGKRRLGPDAPWKEFQTTSTITSILNGRFLQERNSIPAEIVGIPAAPGSRVEFLILYSYDRVHKVYRVGVLDNVFGLLDIYEGQFDNDRLVVSNEGTTAIVRGGIKFAGRNTIYNVSPNSFQSDWEETRDGGKIWMVGLALTYKRKPAP